MLTKHEQSTLQASPKGGEQRPHPTSPRGGEGNINAAVQWRDKWLMMSG